MPEVRLIDRQALLSDIDKEIEFFSSSAGNHDYFDYAKKNGLVIAKQIVGRQPTIEAEPVRRGHWVLTRDEQYEYCHCSECGYDTGENWMIGSEIPYCSQCGSKNYDGGADNG